MKEQDNGKSTAVKSTTPTTATPTTAIRPSNPPVVAKPTGDTKNVGAIRKAPIEEIRDSSGLVTKFGDKGISIEKKS